MTLTGTNVPIAQLTAPSALRLLRNLLTLPYLGFIPIHTDSFVTKRAAEISTQLIVSQGIGGKEFITDNIAPGPRTWDLKGYISGIPFIELSNWFMPSLMAQKLVIDTWYTSRKPVPFRTTDGEILTVLIRECSFIEEPENMNTVRIEVSLQEINYLTMISNVVSGTAKGSMLSNPAVGKAIGLGLVMGGAVVTAIVIGSQGRAPQAIEQEDQAERISTLEIIEIPEIAEDIESFSFYAVTSLGTLNLTFVFINDAWQITSKLGEDGELRTYTLIPTITLNPLAADYSLYFAAEKEAIGLVDITFVEMDFVVW